MMDQMHLLREEMIQQLRVLQDKTDSLQSQVDGMGNGAPGSPSTGLSASGDINNLIRNSDFTFDDSAKGYAAKADRPREWYSRAANLTTQFTESAGAVESAESVKLIKYSNTGSMLATSPNLTVTDATFVAGDLTLNATVARAGTAGATLSSVIDGFTDSNNAALHNNSVGAVSTALVRVFPTKDTLWSRQKGVVEFGGATCLAQPLIQNLPDPGKHLLFQAIFKLNDDAGVVALPAGTGLRASLWDNTAGIQKIIEGAVFNLTGSLISGAGAVKRRYIVEVITPDSSENFFSNVASPLEVTGTPNPTAGSPGQVQISWPAFSEAFQYRIWRSDDATSLTDFYLLGLVNTGVTNFYDNGGRNGAATAIAAKNAKAQATGKNFASGITTGWELFTVVIPIPSTYNKSLTTDKLWLRLDFVDSTGALVAVASKAVLIDRVGLSYNGGNWSPSSLDLTSGAAIVSGSPDPTGGGTGLGPEPGGKGGGGFPLE